MCRTAGAACFILCIKVEAALSSICLISREKTPQSLNLQKMTCWVNSKQHCAFLVLSLSLACFYNAQIAKDGFCQSILNILNIWRNRYHRLKRLTKCNISLFSSKKLKTSALVDRSSWLRHSSLLVKNQELVMEKLFLNYITEMILT